MPRRRDPVRLLGRTGGYTDTPGRALRDGPNIEPEAIAADTQERYSMAATRNQVAARELDRAQRTTAPLDQRIAAARAQAQAAGIDVHAELRICRLAVESGRSVAHVQRRVERLERRAWPSLFL